MRDEPPPPVITIRNPGAPAAPVDVLHAGPELPPRKQLTAQQKRVALLAALIVATTAVGVRAAAHLHRSNELDAASVRALHLQTIPTAVSSFRADIGRDLALGLLNLSGGPLTVVSVRYDAPGFPELRPRTGSLPPDTPTFLLLPLTGDCPRRPLVTTRGGAVVVRLRTSRGIASTVRLSDEGAMGFGSDYASTVARQCHITRPGDSLVSDAPPLAARAGPDLRLTWTVRNSATHARTLQRVETSGIELVASNAPFTLTYNEEHRLSVLLRIASCTGARQAWGVLREHHRATPILQPVNANGAISLVVQGDDAVDPATPFVLPGQVDAIREWIVDRCP